MPGGQTAPDPLSFDPTATAGGAKWYFDNPSALGTARADFIRKYGDRKLVDNWRTSSQITSSPNTPANGNVPLAQTGGDKNQVTALDKAKADSVAKAKAADPEAEKRALVETYRKAIPLTPATLKASDEKIEAAYYKLGGIYKEQLKERESGMATYAKQVDRYPARRTRTRSLLPALRALQRAARRSQNGAVRRCVATRISHVHLRQTDCRPAVPGTRTGAA